MNASPKTVTVLYVEDEECDRHFMEVAFRAAGMGEALRAVVNGREAIDYLAGRGVYADRGRYPAPAAVLLDLNMPLVSGFEVLKWMRGQPEFAALPVVVFTSSSRVEDKVRARELGASEFVEKPQSMGRFREVVELMRKKWLGAVQSAG